uniref:Copine 1 n=1 Tax=Malurus cyaneus samueli TaxID=2593467 RepID=A0A8C5X5W7_9PASS
MAACVCRLELSVPCQSLLHRDLGSRSDPCCVLLRDAGGGRCAELDCTEKIKNCQNPEFCKKLVSFDLNADDYLEGIEYTLGQVPVEIIIKTLPKLGQTGIDFLKNCKSDPFLEFYKQSDAGTWQLIYGSEVIKSNLNPLRRWGGELWLVSLMQVSCPLPAPSFQVQCADHDSNSSHDLIGTLEMTLAERQTAGACSLKKKKQKKRNYNNSGIIRIKSCKMETEYSFLHYVMGGCQIKVNFTASNGDPKSPDSRHYISSVAPKTVASNFVLCDISDFFSPFSFQAPQEALSQRVLAEVPKQLMSYYKWQGLSHFYCKKCKYRKTPSAESFCHRKIRLATMTHDTPHVA